MFFICLTGPILKAEIISIIYYISTVYFILHSKTKKMAINCCISQILSIHPSVYLSVHQSSIYHYLPIRWYVYPSTHPLSIYLSTHHLVVYLSIYPFIIYLSIYPSISFFPSTHPLHVYLPIHPLCTCLSTHLPIHPSSTCLSIHLSFSFYPPTHHLPLPVYLTTHPIIIYWSIYPSFFLFFFFGRYLHT